MCKPRNSLLCVFVLAGSLFGQTTAALSAAQLYEKGMNALTGTGLSRNDVNATDYIRRSAELGYAPAQVTLGYFYETGTILTREPEQGAEWYKKAAQQDDVLGEWLLGPRHFQRSDLHPWHWFSSLCTPSALTVIRLSFSGPILRRTEIRHIPNWPRWSHGRSGFIAAALIDAGVLGVMACFRRLTA